jgi:hypothetical protein
MIAKKQLASSRGQEILEGRGLGSGRGMGSLPSNHRCWVHDDCLAWLWPLLLLLSHVDLSSCLFQVLLLWLWHLITANAFITPPTLAATED